MMKALVKGGPYAPYYQSQRTGLYKEYLALFYEKNLIYRCFCTPEELEKKRQRQLALNNHLGMIEPACY